MPNFSLSKIFFHLKIYLLKWSLRYKMTRHLCTLKCVIFLKM